MQAYISGARTLLYRLIGAHKAFSAAILILAGVTLGLVPRHAVAAASECTLSAVRAAAPHGMTIQNVADATFPSTLKIANGLAEVAANQLKDGAPAYCLVTGTFVTNPATHKTANFAGGLPLGGQWNGKYLQEGCGYNCGQIFAPPSAAMLKQGYSVWMTDDGHHGKPGPSPQLPYATDASWAVISPGKGNTDAVTDFDSRAVHTLTLLGKRFTQAFYDVRKLKESYFDGCSDGGREGIVEASRFPADYDGVLSGAPYFDNTNEQITTLVGILAQLRSPAAALVPSQFELLNRITMQVCDRTDGTRDGLIQNPAACNFDPQKDLPICRAGEKSNQCFTREQVDTVSIIFSAITDPSGKILFPMYAISNPNYDLVQWLGFPAPPTNLHGPNPWSGNPSDQPRGWYWANGTTAAIVYDGASDFNARTTLGITFRRDRVGNQEVMHAVIPDSTVALFESKNAPGSAARPAAVAKFLDMGRKLLIYHGLSDGLITPYRTIEYYMALAKLHGGYGQLQQNAELYLVPGMGHCLGGPGPNIFGQTSMANRPFDAKNDALTALANWVEKGERPTELVATKYEDSKKYETHGIIPVQGTPLVSRTMPLCPFPAVAQYAGSGDVNDSKNWQCASDNTRLLDLGPDGRRVGLQVPLADQAMNYPVH